MIEMSEKISALSKALVGAQADVGKALKNQENAHFKSKYADLAAVLEVAKPALAKHGLALTQFPGEGEGTVTMSTLLLHESGEWILLPPASIPLQANTAHGYGSAISYLRRYTTQAALGISIGLLDDDDGNEATAQAPKARKKAKSPQPGKAAFDPKEVERFAEAKTNQGYADLGRALGTLEAMISAAESDGTKVEARHVQLAREVLAQQGGGIPGGNPLDRVIAATTYLSDALRRS
jgi:hypothetical protein